MWLYVVAFIMAMQLTTCLQTVVPLAACANEHRCCEMEKQVAHMQCIPCRLQAQSATEHSTYNSKVLWAHV